MGHRFLDIDVLSRADRLDDHALVPVIGHRRDDAIDVLVVEQPAILARGRQIRADDFLRERVAPVVEVGGAGADDSRQGNGRAEEAGPLHADADHPEADRVTGGKLAECERLRDERHTGSGGASLEEFPTRPGGFLHGELPEMRVELPIMVADSALRYRAG